ncbi:hypothetical protein [Kiloniella sp. b19]|uniref:hypothetical protein n=1 Tax=Kiloniella sp. GXU_MW_B19 TaxID=3141326 RepID=UPI0031CF91B5
MYLIASAQGPVSQRLTEALLSEGQPLRLLSFSSETTSRWSALRADVQSGDLEDSTVWEQALEAVQAVVLVSSPFDHEQGFAGRDDAFFPAFTEGYDRQFGHLPADEQPSVILLSSLWAGVQGQEGEPEDWSDQLCQAEILLRNSCPNLVVLRSALLVESWKTALPMAKDHSILPGFLPLELAAPWVSIRDVAELLGEALLQREKGQHVVHLHGGESKNAEDLCAALGDVMTKRMMPIVVPQSDHSSVLQQQGHDSRSAALWTGFYRKVMACPEPLPEEGVLPVEAKTALPDALFELFKAYRSEQNRKKDPGRELYDPDMV